MSVYSIISDRSRWEGLAEFITIGILLPRENVGDIYGKRQISAARTLFEEFGEFRV